MRHLQFVAYLIMSSILLTPLLAKAQRQLLLMSGDEVVFRFKQGDALRTKWRDSKVEHWGFVVQVNEFNVVTSQDTVDIAKVRKILLPGRPRANRIGKMLIAGGVLYFAIDQLNWTIVQGHDPSMDDSVWKPAAILVGVGAPLLLFKKNWKRMQRGMRLKSVGEDSRLYLPE